MSKILSRLKAWIRSARGKALLKHDSVLVVTALLAQPAFAALIHGDAVSRDALVAATLVAVKALARKLIPVPPV